MNSNHNWAERIKLLPTWIRAAIAFVTGIVVFISLILSNFYLGITILFSSILIFGFSLCVYVAFSKKESVLVNGDLIPQFPKYRYIATGGMVLFGAIFIGLLIYSPSRSFATIAFVGTPTPLPIFPTIENMRIGELEGEYKIEITTFNPSQQDLLVTHIGISAIETDYSYVCCCGEIGDYKISDQIAVEGDIDNLSFSAKVEQESGELKGFTFPAEVQ